MTDTKMTKEQKALLKPHAQHFCDMIAFIATRDVSELAALNEACNAASDTNCGWDTFAAARYMSGEIRTELRQREIKKRESELSVGELDGEKNERN